MPNQIHTIILALVCILLPRAVFAVAFTNETAHNIESKHVQKNEYDGYQITIDKTPSLDGAIFSVFSGYGAPTHALLELAESLPVIFGQPAKIEFKKTQLCPGLAKRDAVEAIITDESGSYILCFVKKDGLYISLDFRER